MGITVYKHVEVEVEVDEEDLADMCDKELARCGLFRGATQPESLETSRPLDVQWRAVRHAIIDGDQRHLVDLLNTMAWAQAGVMIPVVPALRSVSA